MPSPLSSPPRAPSSRGSRPSAPRPPASPTGPRTSPTAPRAVGAPAPRGAPAAGREPLRHQLQPGRLPDPARLPGAEADLRDGAGARAGGVPPLRLDPPQLVPRVAPAPRRRATPAGPSRGAL